MSSFYSDNTSIADPVILQALIDANQEAAPAYGQDDYTEKLQCLLSSVFGKEAFGLPVATGTAANCISLRVLCPSYGVVFCDGSAHILVDECGAPTFFNPGMKLIGIDSLSGRIELEALERTFDRITPGLFHGFPSAISISQCTERGCVYSLNQLSEISQFCRIHDLSLHLDGARLANALARLGCPADELIDACQPDTVALGLSKSGGAIAEVIVTFEKERFEQAKRIAKQSGHLVSKQRFLSEQLNADLGSGNWIQRAAHANEMAQLIARHYENRLIVPVEANEVFLKTSGSDEAELRMAGIQFANWPIGQKRGIRLVTSWSTKVNDLDALFNALPDSKVS